MTKIGQVVFEKIAGQTRRQSQLLTDALAFYYYRYFQSVKNRISCLIIVPLTCLISELGNETHSLLLLVYNIYLVVFYYV